MSQHGRLTIGFLRLKTSSLMREYMGGKLGGDH